MSERRKRNRSSSRDDTRDSDRRHHRREDEYRSSTSSRTKKKKKKSSSSRSSRRSRSQSPQHHHRISGEKSSSRRKKEDRKKSNGKSDEKDDDLKIKVKEIDATEKLMELTSDEKEKRIQRLKNWQAERKKVETKIVKPNDAAKTACVSSKLWNVDESKSVLPKLTEDVEEEIKVACEETGEDPLDAFMVGLEGAATQEAYVGARGGKVPVSVTLDDIAGMGGKLYSSEKPIKEMSGTFLPDEESDSVDQFGPSQPNTPPMDPVEMKFENYGGVTPGREETGQQQEERERREHAEFMEAIRRRNKAESGAIVLQDKEEEEVQAKPKEKLGRIYQGEDEDAIGENAAKVEKQSALEILREREKKKELKSVDHSTIEYIKFRKKFYTAPKDVINQTEEEVAALRKSLEIKVRGKNCPRPISKWTQCGFSQRMLQLIQKHGFENPFAIQQQALPAIMSGRDVIGVAKTGSGKTLAFLLPMLRHILDQPPLNEGDGPIGLIMAPARELAQQIYGEVKKFCKELNLRATAIYGGTPIAEQIANLKRRSDVVICTPGRMIEILTMNAGKLFSLQRTTYIVLDEADRMFDMGFEPQISKIMGNIRRDRQTLLFSATFPRSVESLARKVLTKPVEITVGARSTAPGDITQYVEVREERDKFPRLLQLLGTWYTKGNILVFVNTQQSCDNLFSRLMSAGYHALSLHGGKEQSDRDYTIDDFKRKVRTLMVATSVAGRGLDVKDLVLVINYHCPNHMEDYVHRVGRTGRAGRKGTAYTFISPEEEEYAPDLVRALQNGKQTIPAELTAMNEKFKEKVKKGEARYHGSGFKGKGYTFDENEKTESQRNADLQRKQYEVDQGHIDDDDGRSFEAPKESETGPSEATTTTPRGSGPLTGAQKAAQIAAMLHMQHKRKQTVGEMKDDGIAVLEFEINDYPQQARFKATQRDFIRSVTELTGANVTIRGQFVPAGRKPNPGERKLFFNIEASNLQSAQEARRELQRVLDEMALKVGLYSRK